MPGYSERTSATSIISFRSDVSSANITLLVLGSQGGWGNRLVKPETKQQQARAGKPQPNHNPPEVRKLNEIPSPKHSLCNSIKGGRGMVSQSAVFLSTELSDFLLLTEFRSAWRICCLFVCPGELANCFAELRALCAELTTQRASLTLLHPSCLSGPISRDTAILSLR